MFRPPELSPACCSSIELTDQNQPYPSAIPPILPIQKKPPKNIPYPLVLENLALYLHYLQPSEAVRLLLTCRRFHCSGSWKALCKLQWPLNWDNDLFHHQIDQISEKEQALAYNHLFGLRNQQLQEPWKVKASIMVGSPRSFPRVAILSNGYVVIGHRSINILSRTCTEKMATIAAEILHPATDPASENFISNIVALPGGGFVTSTSRGSQAHIWSALGDLIATLTHDGRVTCIAVYTNGDIITGSKDTKIRRWTPDGKLIMTHSGHTKPISGILILRNDSLVSCHGNRVIIWPLDSDRAKILDHPGLVGMASLQTEGLVTISWDGRAVIWSLGGECVSTFIHPSADHLSIHVAVLSNGNILTVGYKEARPCLRSPDGKAIATLKGHTAPINSIATLPGGFVTASDDRTARIWSLNGQLIAILKGHAAIESVMAFQDGEIATLDSNGTLYIWSVDIESLLKVRSVWEKATCVMS